MRAHTLCKIFMTRGLYCVNATIAGEHQSLSDKILFIGDHVRYRLRSKESEKNNHNIDYLKGFIFSSVSHLSSAETNKAGIWVYSKSGSTAA